MEASNCSFRSTGIAVLTTPTSKHSDFCIPAVGSDEVVQPPTDKKTCQLNKTSFLSSVRSDEQQLTCSPPSRARKWLSEDTCCRLNHPTGSLQAFHTICQVRIKQHRTVRTRGSLTPSNNPPLHTKLAVKRHAWIELAGLCVCELFFQSLIL